MIRSLVLVVVLLGFVGSARSDQIVPTDRVVTSVILRAEPDTTSPRLGSLSPGESAELLEDVPNFYKVKLSSGTIGFVSKRWTDLLTAGVAQRQPVQPMTAAVARVPPAELRMTAHIIDVSQGNAALLEFPCAAVLIDAGGQNANTTQDILDYLAAFFSRRTDLNNALAVVFITHTHIDHNRALRKIVETFKVDGYVHSGTYTGSGKAGAIWMRDHANDDGRSIETREVADSEITGLPSKTGLSDSTIDPVSCPQVDPKISVLSGRVDEDPGWSHGEFGNLNNHSLVVRVDFGQASFLFTGDLEEPAIETMVDYYDGTSRLDVDVYHVGHHGSYNGSTASLLRAMSPKIALISMSPESDHRSWTAWKYGHPRDVAVAMLKGGISGSRPPKQVRVANAVETFASENMTKAIYATGWDGTIDIVAGTDGGLSVSPER